MNTFYNLFSHDSNGDICWNIYSVGDPMFLQNVFNALGMMSNSGYISALVVIGGMLGVILMGFSSIISQKGFDLGTFTVCCIVSIFMFTETAHVNVHDVFSDEDRDVQNVPYGVAVAGSVISTLGMGIADLFEQGFRDVNSNASLTGAGSGSGNAFASPLYILNALARAGHTEGIFAAIDKGNGGTLSNDGTDGGGMKPDFRQSAINYFKDCTMTGIALRKYTWSDIWHGSFGSGSSSSSSTLSSRDPVQFDSKIYFTHLCPGGACVNMSCHDAYPKLKSMITNAATEQSAALASFLNAQLDQTREKVSDIVLGTGKNVTQTGYLDVAKRAMDVMGFSTQSMMNFVEASIWEEIAYLGQESYFQDARDVQSVLMIEQARRQRNVQNASEGEMFRNSIRPMMTFIEGFTYAVTPIAAMLIMMGAFGLKLALKYFTLLIWVQSWLPCMAIVNNYIITSARRGMLELGGISSTYSFGSAADSMYAIDKITEVTQDYIATGGMMLAAVPVLTLFLFTGSVYALAQLTARMHGGDLVNEQMLEPNAQQIGSVVSRQTQMDFGVGNAGLQAGAVDQSLTLSSNLGVSATEAQMSLVQKSHEFATQFAKGWTDNWSTAKGDQLVGAINKAFGNLDNDQKQISINVGKEVLANTGAEASEAETAKIGGMVQLMASNHVAPSVIGSAVASAVTSGAFSDGNGASGGGVSPNGRFAKEKGIAAKDPSLRLNSRPSVNAGAGVSYSHGRSVDAKVVAGNAERIASNAGVNDGTSNAWTNGVVASLANSQSVGHSFNQSASESDSLSESAKEVLNASTTFNTASSSQDSMGFTHTYTYRQITGNVGEAQFDRDLESLGLSDAERRFIDSRVRMGERLHLNGPESGYIAKIKAATELQGGKGALMEKMLISRMEGGGGRFQDLRNPVDRTPGFENISNEADNARAALGGNAINGYDYRQGLASQAAGADPRAQYANGMDEVRDARAASRGAVTSESKNNMAAQDIYHLSEDFDNATYTFAGGQPQDKDAAWFGTFDSKDDLKSFKLSGVDVDQFGERNLAASVTGLFVDTKARKVYDNLVNNEHLSKEQAADVLATSKLEGLGLEPGSEQYVATKEFMKSGILVGEAIKEESSKLSGSTHSVVGMKQTREWKEAHQARVAQQRDLQEKFQNFKHSFKNLNETQAAGMANASIQLISRGDGTQAETAQGYFSHGVRIDRALEQKKADPEGFDKAMRKVSEYGKY